MDHLSCSEHVYVGGAPSSPDSANFQTAGGRCFYVALFLRGALPSAATGLAHCTEPHVKGAQVAPAGAVLCQPGTPREGQRTDSRGPDLGGCGSVDGSLTRSPRSARPSARDSCRPLSLKPAQRIHSVQSSAKRMGSASAFSRIGGAACRQSRPCCKGGANFGCRSAAALSRW